MEVGDIVTLKGECTGNASFEGREASLNLSFTLVLGKDYEKRVRNWLERQSLEDFIWLHYHGGLDEGLSLIDSEESLKLLLDCETMTDYLMRRALAK